MAQSQAQTTVDTTVANGPNPTTQSPTTQSEGIGSPLPPTGDFMHMLSDENRQIIHRLCTEPVPHMDHPDLHRAKADVELFGVAAKLSPSDGFRFEPPKEITAGRISPATRAPTLTGNQEKQLFLRLNLTRMKICNILNRYTDRPLTPKAARTLIAWGDWELKVREQVVELNMPLVLAMAKRTRLSNIDFNEMISEGNMALLRSVDKFDCGRGFKFSTYACRAILKSFSRVAMKASRYRGTFPVEYDPSIEKSDHVETQRAQVESDCIVELKDIIEANAASLSDVEKTVILERFALAPKASEVPTPKTLEQVGTIIGVTKERVRQIQNKALKKIRHALENGYLAAG
ncbi:MAG: sigma-70 family RNA polymerase sigma factor [Phycisphaerales bacterium]|nr:sigma-70 family RNA polymerase sigma factor [Phycisphaerales bacterium]